MLLTFAIFLLSGCATYRAMPLTAKAVDADLEAPTAEELHVRAASITHPVLEPVDLDTSDGLSPDEAAVLAVILNPELRAERDRRGVAGAEVLKAGILPNPRLSYSLEVPVGGTKPDTVNAYGFGLGWDTGALVTRGARLAAAKSRLKSVERDIAWKEWQVAEKAKLGLYLYAIAGKRVAVATRREETSRKIYALTKRAVTLGIKTSPELTCASAALEEGRAALIKAQSDLEARRLGLNLTIGLPIETPVTPEKTLEPGVFRSVPDVKSLAEGIEGRRLDIMALGLGYRSEEARLRAAILSQFPSIKIGPIGAKDTDGVKTAGGLLEVEFPIFDRNQGNIALERATRKRLFDEYAARVFEARSEVARLHAGLSSLEKRIEREKALIRGLEERRGDYGLAMKGGALDAIDYYGFLAALEERRLRLIDMEEEAAVEAVALETASGRYIFRRDRKKRGSPHGTKKRRR